MQLTKLIFPKTHLFVFLNAHRFVLWIMDIYYPSGEGIVLAREAASASPASLPVAFSSVQRGDVVRLRAHTTGRINRIEQFN